MTRSVASTAALVTLLLLTAVTWALFEEGAGAGMLLGVAAAKSAVIGLVFLELDRSHPAWLLLGAALVGGLATGVTLLLP